jgi:hypothetical protein
MDLTPVVPELVGGHECGVRHFAGQVPMRGIDEPLRNAFCQPPLRSACCIRAGTKKPEKVPPPHVRLPFHSAFIY